MKKKKKERRRKQSLDSPQTIEANKNVSNKFQTNVCSFIFRFDNRSTTSKNEKINVF